MLSRFLGDEILTPGASHFQQYDLTVLQVAEPQVLSDDENCRTYCLTGEWHPPAGSCLTQKYTLDPLT
jgi:hypothetical protein